ncbi:MAG TPA: hypothetical protein VFX49_00025 [Chloroflexota bacterium]|nr:hypothetical protein [Chloroflexota bacterium]
MAALVWVSWMGEYLHNLIELGLSPLSPENSVMAFVAAGLMIWWWRAPDDGKRTATASLLGLGLLHLVGGSLSVLPLPLLPFVPAQTAGHYASHALYAAAQVPLVVAMLRALR